MKDEMEWVQLLTYMYWNDVYKNDTKNNTKHNTKNKNNNTKRMKILAVNHFSDSMFIFKNFFLGCSGPSENARTTPGKFFLQKIVFF